MEKVRSVFVTGGTGFIGCRLIQALLQQGHTVRALTRRPNPAPPPVISAGENPLVHPNVELVVGDITDRESLRRGMQGCSHVYHLAAYARNWARDPKTFDTMNVLGMHNVLDVADECRVERIVWTSTIATCGTPAPGQIGDEATLLDPEHCPTEYARSKALAQRDAIRRARRGLPVVIVNPTRVYGPGHLSESNSLVRLLDLYDRGRMPFLPNRGVNVGNYVYVDDVVQGHLLAMEHGRIGELYILGGENVPLRFLFQQIDQLSGRRHFQIPLYTIAPMVFAHLQQKLADWFHIYPQITPGWVRLYLSDRPFSSEKAERELGYQPRSVTEGVRLTYEWILRLRQVPAPDAPEDRHTPHFRIRRTPMPHHPVSLAR